MIVMSFSMLLSTYNTGLPREIAQENKQITKKDQQEKLPASFTFMRPNSRCRYRTQFAFLYAGTVGGGGGERDLHIKGEGYSSSRLGV